MACGGVRAAEPTLLCGFDTKYMCAPGQACSAAPADEILIRFEQGPNLYWRCEKSSGQCSQYSVVVSKDGPAAYTNIDITGRGAFAKLGPKGDFTEVVSLGSKTLISFGQCFDEQMVAEPAPDP